MLPPQLFQPANSPTDSIPDGASGQETSTSHDSPPGGHDETSRVGMVSKQLQPQGGKEVLKRWWRGIACLVCVLANWPGAGATKPTMRDAGGTVFFCACRKGVGVDGCRGEKGRKREKKDGAIGECNRRVWRRNQLSKAGNEPKKCRNGQFKRRGEQNPLGRWALRGATAAASSSVNGAAVTFSRPLLADPAGASSREGPGSFSKAGRGFLARKQTTPHSLLSSRNLPQP